MGLEKNTKISFELVTTGEKTTCKVNKQELEANSRQQEIDRFHDDIHFFFNAVKSFRKLFNMKNSDARALCTVMDAYAEGKLANHIFFDGFTVTTSKEGNITMTLYINYKIHMDPDSVEVGEEEDS